MGAGERTSDSAVVYRAADCNQIHRLRLGKISSSLRVTLMEYSVLDQDQTLQGRHCLIPRRMWDENTPERAALMTFALRSPETRQNTARTPGSSPANACTCVSSNKLCPASLQHTRHSLHCLQAAGSADDSGFCAEVAAA